MSELAWAAGLFDGEGTATTCRGRPRLAVQMNDEHSVRRFAAAIGTGRVYGPYVHAGRDGYTRQPRYVWLAEGDELTVAAAALAPWLGVTKRAQIARIAKNVETGNVTPGCTYPTPAPQ